MVNHLRYNLRSWWSSPWRSSSLWASSLRQNARSAGARNDKTTVKFVLRVPCKVWPIMEEIRIPGSIKEVLWTVVLLNTQYGLNLNTSCLLLHLHPTSSTEYRPFYRYPSQLAWQFRACLRCLIKQWAILRKVCCHGFHELFRNPKQTGKLPHSLKSSWPERCWRANS